MRPTSDAESLIDAPDGDAAAASRTKYIVVTGGTLSGIGKGTCMSAIGVVLKAMGFSVTCLKIDPYLNVDAGTMSPYEHGEVFVLEDGGEVDLDLGNYERSLGVTLSSSHNITTGKIYSQVIKRERAGGFLGKTVQVIPHVTNAIQNWIKRVAGNPIEHNGELTCPDFCLIEVGGTVGDIESSVYLEALQQLAGSLSPTDFCLCHVSFVPLIGSEAKTKPTQHSVKELRHAGLSPSFLMCRSEQPLENAHREKIAMFSQLRPDHVLSMQNVAHSYHVPLVLQAQDFGRLIAEQLQVTPVVKLPTEVRVTEDEARNFVYPPRNSRGQLTFAAWAALAVRKDTATEPVRIALVGKYTAQQDTYLSVCQALEHAALLHHLKLEVVKIDSSKLGAPPIVGEEQPSAPASDAEAAAAWALLKSCSGILIPGGFGCRGAGGMIAAITYARENQVPLFGICLGMQLIVIEFCRCVLGWPSANSEEFDPRAETMAVVFMPEHSTEIMGGTMRLGNRATILRDKASLAFRLYNNEPVIFERHRHRYEINPLLVLALQAAGLRFVGQDDRGQRMEICEIRDHPFFLGVQFHPEFTSYPLSPNPCFAGFVKAAMEAAHSR